MVCGMYRKAKNLVIHSRAGGTAAVLKQVVLSDLCVNLTLYFQRTKFPLFSFWWHLGTFGIAMIITNILGDKFQSFIIKNRDREKKGFTLMQTGVICLDLCGIPMHTTWA